MTISVKFGISNATFISFIDINTLVGKLRFHVFNTGTLFLLSLADIDRNKLYFNNLINTLRKENEQREVLIVRRFGYP